MDIQNVIQRIYNWVISSGVQILIILVLMFIALKLSRIISRKTLNLFQKNKDDEEFRKRTETLGAVIRYIISFAVLAMAIIMIMGEMGIEIGPILAAAGVLGLAVGFGAQNLVQDLISGFFILLEDQIRVGDVVQIAGKGGLVEKINLRMTILRDLAGNVHYVRNGQISIVTNMTKDYSRYVFEIGVAYRENVDEVVKVIEQVDQELRNDEDFKSDILEPIEVLGLDQFADSAIIIKARTTTKPIKQWRIAREFNRRLKKAFDERDIEIPFPHMTLYMGKDKKGDSPPMNVELMKMEKE